ncbi:hypothetical protein ABBQ32_009320 [Trebouxia sp. C0010 RCD-2024]
MRKSRATLYGATIVCVSLLGLWLDMNILSRLVAKPSGFEQRATSTAGKAIRMGRLRKIPQESLHVSKPTWWLESRFHFSFADYHNPSNSNFGALRVVNDDLVQGNAGFGTHPHRDAEIFSYIVDGHLSHKDSMGNCEALPRGCVQYLSAGTGISHSEMNEQPERTRFLQIWMTPDKRGHKPQYGSSKYSKSDRQNKLLHILGGTGTMPSWKTVTPGAGIALHQDANVFVSEADAGVSQEISLRQDRQAYLVCIEGSLAVNDEKLSARDAIEIVAEENCSFPVKLTAGEKGAHFLLMEMQRA